MSCRDEGTFREGFAGAEMLHGERLSWCVLALIAVFGLVFAGGLTAIAAHSPAAHPGKQPSRVAGCSGAAECGPTTKLTPVAGPVR
ncbi:MAG: hypothetical protein AAGH15_03730 [Myxococcota bacterium]